MRLRLAASIASLALCACSSHRGQGPSSIPSPLEVATGAYPMHGHAVNYEWIAGTVERDLRCVYVDISASGRSGADDRIALVVTADQGAQLKQGDTVVIKGELSRLGYGSCGTPSYVISSIEEH